MNGKPTDDALAKLIGSLPCHAPSAGFNGRVLARLGVAQEAAPARRWMFWAESAAGVLGACWLGSAVFAAALLAAAYYGDILSYLVRPWALLSIAKLAVLKAGFWAMDMLRFLSIGKAVLADRAGGFYLLPKLAVSTMLSVAVIVSLSCRTHAQGAARR